MNEDGQIDESQTEASGLDFSGVGPEISYMHSIKEFNSEQLQIKKHRNFFNDV